MREPKPLLFMLCFLVLVTSCTPREEPKSSSILGVVIDGESNAVLAGVKVSTPSPARTTSTSTLGVFELSPLPTSGSLQIEFQGSGYKPSMRQVQLAEGKVFLEVLLERDQKIATTTVEDVKLRASPSLEAEILEILPKDTSVILTGETEVGWYKVQFQEKTGWLWGGFLKSKDSPIPSAQCLVDGKLMSSEGGEEVGDVYAGLGVILLESKGSWARVLLPSGLEGWIEMVALTH